MGCNYYLYKKDGSKWNVPTSNLGTLVGKLLVEFSDKGNNELPLSVDNCLSKEDGLHIGKSSFGWNFGLCIYPCMNIYSLKDWEKMFDDESYEIKNEYGETLTKENMIDVITKRHAPGYDKFKNQEEFERDELESSNGLYKELNKIDYDKFKTYDEYLEFNHATRGKNGLLSHVSSIWDERDNEKWSKFMPMIDTYIRTDGTYDLTTSWDFS